MATNGNPMCACLCLCVHAWHSVEREVQSEQNVYMLGKVMPVATNTKMIKGNIQTT